MEYAVLTPVFEDGEDEPEELSLTALFLAHFCTPSERCRILTSFAGDDSQKAQLVLAMEQLQQREEQAASRSKLSTPSQPHTPSGDVERAISWCTREAQEAAATVAVSQHALEATSPVAHEEDRQGATFKSTSVAAAGAATTSVPAPALPQATASAPPASPGASGVRASSPSATAAAAAPTEGAGGAAGANVPTPARTIRSHPTSSSGSPGHLSVRNSKRRCSLYSPELPPPDLHSSLSQSSFSSTSTMSSSCATQQHTGPQGNHASAAQPTQQIGLEGRSSCSSSSSSDTSRIYSPIRSSTEPSIRDHNSYDEPMGRAPTAGAPACAEMAGHALRAASSARSSTSETADAPGLLPMTMADNPAEGGTGGADGDGGKQSRAVQGAAVGEPGEQSGAISKPNSSSSLHARSDSNSSSGADGERVEGEGAAPQQGAEGTIRHADWQQGGVQAGKRQGVKGSSVDSMRSEGGRKYDPLEPMWVKQKSRNAYAVDLERQMDALKLGLEEIRASTSIDESAGARKGKEPTDAGTATSTTGSKDSAAAGSGDAHWQQGEDGDKSVGRNFSFRWGLPHATSKPAEEKPPLQVRVTGGVTPDLDGASLGQPDTSTPTKHSGSTLSRTESKVAMMQLLVRQLTALKAEVANRKFGNHPAASPKGTPSPLGPFSPSIPLPNGNPGTAAAAAATVQSPASQHPASPHTGASLPSPRTPSALASAAGAGPTQGSSPAAARLAELQAKAFQLLATMDSQGKRAGPAAPFALLSPHNARHGSLAGHSAPAGHGVLARHSAPVGQGTPAGQVAVVPLTAATPSSSAASWQDELRSRALQLLNMHDRSRPGPGSPSAPQPTSTMSSQPTQLSLQLPASPELPAPGASPNAGSAQLPPTQAPSTALNATPMSPAAAAAAASGTGAAKSQAAARLEELQAKALRLMASRSMHTSGHQVPGAFSAPGSPQAAAHPLFATQSARNSSMGHNSGGPAYPGTLNTLSPHHQHKTVPSLNGTDVRLRALELLSSSSSPSYKPKDAALPSRSISVALPAAAANEARSAGAAALAPTPSSDHATRDFLRQDSGGSWRTWSPRDI